MQRKKSIRSEHPTNGEFHPELPQISMYDFLKEQNTKNLHRVALEFEGRKTTYAQFFEDVETAANALTALGIQPGDIVSIVSPNLPQALVTIYAANAVGAVCNMLHPALSAGEIQRRVEETQSVAVFISEQLYAGIADASWNLPQAPQIVLYRIPDALPLWKSAVCRLSDKRPVFADADRRMDWREFLALGRSAGARPAYHGAADEVAMIMYSGGTTGIPKGVCLTNGNFNRLSISGVAAKPALVSAKSLAVIPIFHGFGFGASIHTMLCVGGHIYLVSKYHIETCNRLVFKKKVEIIFGIPAVFDALSRSPEMEKRDLSFFKLMVCGGDRLALRTKNRIDRYLETSHVGIHLSEGYGMTECVASCLLNYGKTDKSGSCGRPMPYISAKIIDPETGEELPVGEIGELCVSGPTVMKGYFRDPEATAQALVTDESGRVWLRTGDAFSVDAEGCYFFRYRLSRMIVTSGYNVYPTQVEEVISQLPFVKRCCVVGAREAVIGERVVAFVSIDEEKLPPDLTDKLQIQILNHCRANLEEYAVPQEIRLQRELPLTKVGKLDYRKLESLAAENNG